MTDFVPHEAPANDVSQLPVANPGRPVGRDDLLRQTFSSLQSRQAVLLYGNSGNGKTTLAAALAAAFVQQAGGVIWLSDNTHPLPALLVQIGRALGVDEISNSEQPAAHVGTLATELTQRKPFIVLDNVTDAFAVQQFIDKCADNLPMLIVSDDDLEGSWENVHIDPLLDTNALTLFKQKAGINNGDSDIDIYGITKLLKYQPLPIVLAARSMVAAKQSPDDYFKSLKQTAQASDDGVTAAIALSYRALNNALQGLLLMLGATFRGEGSVDYIAEVSNVPENSITQAMNILAQLYLVEKFERYGKPYYRLHPRIYAFMQDVLTGKNQFDSLRQKVHDATLAYAQKYSGSDLSPQHLAKEMANFLAVATWSAENGNRDTANQLVSALTQADDFVQDAGYVYELLQLRNTASGSTSAFPAYGHETMAVEDDDDGYYDYDEDEEDLYAAVADIDTDDDVYEAPTLDDLNVTEGMTSDAIGTENLEGIDVDDLRQALAQAKQQGNTARQKQILKAIGKVQVGQGKETEAITTYNEILELHENDGDTDETLETLNMLAALLAKTGNSQAAVMHATRGISMADEQGDDTLKLQLLTSLGDARQELGETQAAVDAFSQALEIARTTDDKQNEAISLYKLGYAYLDNGDTDDAIHNLEQARELFKTQSKRDYEGRVLGGLGNAHSELEQWVEAIGYYQSALHIAREVGNKGDEQVHLNNLGQAQVEANRLPDALLSYRQALHLAYQSGNRDEIVTAVVDLVRLMLKSNRLLDICQLLLDDAKELEPDDRDVVSLQQQIDATRADADAKGVQQAPVNGTAREYAANAYSLLEN